MTGTHRTATRASAIIAAAIVGSCVVGLAPGAPASPCDRLTLSMTPQPALSGPGAPATAPTNAVPVPAANTAGAAGNSLPAPGQAPFIPPVVGADGAPTETFG